MVIFFFFMNADSISFNTKSHTYVPFCKSTKWRTWRRTEVKSNKVLPFVIERKTVNRIRQDILLNDKWKRKWYCETFLSQNKTYIMDYSTSGEWWYYHAYDDLTTWHLKSTLQSCLLMLQLLTGKKYAILYACTETSVCSFVALHCIVGYTISDMKCGIAWHMLVTLQASTFFVRTLRKREYNTVLIYLSWNYSYVQSK